MAESLKHKCHDVTKRSQWQLNSKLKELLQQLFVVCCVLAQFFAAKGRAYIAGLTF